MPLSPSSSSSLLDVHDAAPRFEAGDPVGESVELVPAKVELLKAWEGFQAFGQGAKSVGSQVQLDQLLESGERVRKRVALEGRAAGLFRPLPLYWLRVETEVENKDQLLDWIEEQILFSPIAEAKVPLALGRRRG